MSAPAGRRDRPRERRAKHPGRRPTGLRVTLSEEELAQLRARAQKAGVSMSRLLVESALAQVETKAERQRVVVKLNRFERLLGNLANNVNQLARQANIAGQVVAVGRVTGYLDELAEMRDELHRIVGELR
ncbi:plasmid mobilization relaxosome protein MobC [Conexibacter sp. DBS9H8]|uniref:plasmid mobilization protein n=1 Tax=Conexibacter sp. DBS9H8 TaxID=2937801 RepID=UPI0035307AF5